MNIFKIVIVLMMFIVVSALVVGNTSIGEGFFTFNSKGKAEDALEESRDIEHAMQAYAAEYGDGKVRFGDPLEGEELFLYLKDKDLLKNFVGNEVNSQIDEWILSEDGESVMGVVKQEQICKHINRNKHGISLEEDVPTCGTPESEGLTCCFEEPDNT